MRAVTDGSEGERSRSTPSSPGRVAASIVAGPVHHEPPTRIAPDPELDPIATRIVAWARRRCPVIHREVDASGASDPANVLAAVEVDPFDPDDPDHVAIVERIDRSPVEAIAIVTTRCLREGWGAYNHRVHVVRVRERFVEPVTFEPVRSGDLGSIDEVIGAELERRGPEVRLVARYLQIGAGTCGFSTTYLWDGERFEYEFSRVRDECLVPTPQLAPLSFPIDAPPERRCDATIAMTGPHRATVRVTDRRVTRDVPIDLPDECRDGERESLVCGDDHDILYSIFPDAGAWTVVRFRRDGDSREVLRIARRCSLD